MTTNEIFTDRGLNHGANFRFEYLLESQKNELEGEEYISYGVLAKMVYEHGEEVSASIEDITAEQCIAHNLIQVLDSTKISPMYLKPFVEDFLVNWAVT